MSVYPLFSDGMSRHESRLSTDLEQATSTIIERARQLVNQLVDNRGNDEPPFLPEEFARLQGIKKIVKADLGNTSGVLLRSPEGYVIKVNQNHSLARQNFSCAHEIGHTLLSDLNLGPYIQGIEHRTFNPQANSEARAKAIERLCEAAATELLMPEFVFRKYLSSSSISINSIEYLSKIFRVSVPAAAIRIAEVSLDPCIALLWKLKLGTEPKMLKLAWCVGPGRKLAYYRPVHANIKYPSILHEAYECENTVKCYKKFRRGTDIKRLRMESKGFGHNETRNVISLAFLSMSQ